MDGKIVAIVKGFGPKISGKDDDGRLYGQPLREVRAYWEALRHNEGIPARDAIDPRGIAGALAQVFMIERIAPRLARFRLVGSQISELVGCDMRGMPFTALFDPVGRDRSGQMLESLFSGPAILHVNMEAERGIGRPAMSAHLLLLPLMSHSGNVDLALGCLTLDGPMGRAPRRFAIARSQTEALGSSMPQTPEVASAPAFAETPEAFAMPRAPRAQGNLRLVHSTE